MFIIEKDQTTPVSGSFRLKAEIRW